MEKHCDGLPRASDSARDVFLQYNVHGRLNSLLNMVMVGHSVVPVVIVFVEWLVIYKICVNNNNKYVVDITAVLAERFPFSSSRATAKVTIFSLRFRDLLMEISVGIYTDLKCDK